MVDDPPDHEDVNGNLPAVHEGGGGGRARLSGSLCQVYEREGW